MKRNSFLVLLFVLILLASQFAVFEFGFVPVKAQGSKQPIMGNSSLPDWKNITITVAGDGKSFTLNNADNLTWTFLYGANKYNSIYQSGVQIVKDELWLLQVYDGSWKDIGSSVNVFYERVTSYNVLVTQSYTSANGDYNVTWDFYGGFRPKISLVAKITVAGNYRVDWRTYVYKEYAINMTNYVKFWNSGEDAVVFDYSDVYEAFGNITNVEGVEGWTKGNRFDLVFNGILGVGVFRLDPNFGYETKGATAVTIENYIRGSKFWVFGEGMLGNITVYLYVTTVAHNVKCAIYNSTFNLLGSTETKSVAKNTNTWVIFSFASPIWLPVNNYYWLLMWGSATSGDVVAYYDAGDADKGLYKSSTFGDWQTTLTGYTLASTKFSIYGSYQSYSTANFGYETLGSSVAYIEDWVGGSVFTITENGVADSITVGLKAYTAAWNNNAKCAIYQHNNLSLIGVTEERTISVTTTAGWFTFNFITKPSLTANTAYILVVWGKASTGDPCLVGVSGGTDQSHRQNIAYNGFPNPLNPGHADYKWSIYCTYETHTTFTHNYWTTSTGATTTDTWDVIVIDVDPTTTTSQTSVVLTSIISTSTTGTSTISASTTATTTGTTTATSCTTLSSTSTETTSVTATVTSTSTETSWATTTLPTTSISTSLTTTTLPTTSTETSLTCTTLETTSTSTSWSTTTFPTTSTETSLTCTTLETTSISTSLTTTTLPTTTTETSLTCTTLQTTSTSISSTTTTTETTSVSTSLTCTTLPTTSTSVSSTTTTTETTSTETSKTTTTTQTTSTLTSLTCTTLPTTSISTSLTCTTLGTTSTSTSTSLTCTTLPTTSTSTSLTCTTFETTTISTSLTCTTLETTSVSTSWTTSTFPTTSTETSLTSTTLETTSTSISATTTTTGTTSTSLTCTTLPITSVSTSLTCTTFETTSISTSETTTTLESTTSSITTTTFSTTSISTSLTCTTFQFTETSMSLTTTTTTFTQSHMTVTTLTIMSTVTSSSSTTVTFALTTQTMTFTTTIRSPGIGINFFAVRVINWQGSPICNVTVFIRSYGLNQTSNLSTDKDGYAKFQVPNDLYDVWAVTGRTLRTTGYNPGNLVVVQYTWYLLIEDFLVWAPLLIPNWLIILIAAIIIAIGVYLLFKSA